LTSRFHLAEQRTNPFDLVTGLSLVVHGAGAIGVGLGELGLPSFERAHKRFSLGANGCQLSTARFHLAEGRADALDFAPSASFVACRAGVVGPGLDKLGLALLERAQEHASLGAKG
jgi:hypothetical protein